MPEVTAPQQDFSSAVDAKLTPAERKASARLRWEDRLTSLWAPVTVLALVFLVYLIIVELADCSYLWLQPPMQLLAGVTFLWWAGLVIARIVARRWSSRRIARGTAEELLSEVEKVISKNQAEVPPKRWAELVEKTAALMQALPGDAGPLKESTKQLDTAFASYRRNAVFDFGSGFIKALLIAVIVRSVFIEPFKIPSGSMIPTLEIGDQIFVNKFIYGVRIPFTNYVPFSIVRPPKRGDIIVFNNPYSPDLDYIKRVVGIGGDTIEFKGREVIVNGQVLPTRDAVADLTVHDQQRQSFDGPIAWFKDWFESDDWEELHPALHFEKLDGKEHYVLYERYASFSDGSYTVPAGEVFVMGDNRDHSADARFGLVPSRGVKFVSVPLGHIKGKATVIWLPLGHGGWFSNIFGGTGLRVERLFLPLTLCADELPRVK